MVRVRTATLDIDQSLAFGAPVPTTLIILSCARVDGNVHTNGCENFWSLLKRAIKGTYVSIEPFHLFRYLDEQAFRFNNRVGTDAERFALALKGIINKRLTYTALTGSELPQTC